MKMANAFIFAVITTVSGLFGMAVVTFLFKGLDGFSAWGDYEVRGLIVAAVVGTICGSFSE